MTGKPSKSARALAAAEEYLRSHGPQRRDVVLTVMGREGLAFYTAMDLCLRAMRRGQFRVVSRDENGRPTLALPEDE